MDFYTLKAQSWKKMFLRLSRK